VQPLGLAVGGVGVGDKAQMGDDPPRAGRVKPAGGLQQHRFGQGLGRCGQRTAEQGSGGADAAAGGGGTHAEPAA
jgi:hypothetical protein